MVSKINAPYNLKLFLAFFAIYIVWGSTFSMVAIALKTFPPLVLNTFRFLIGGSLLAVYCLYKKEPLPRIKDIGTYMISGIVIFLGGVVAIVWAQQYISSSLASVIITTPFWFIVLDKRNWKATLRSPYIIAGMILSLSGVITLLLNKQPHGEYAGKNSPVMAILVIIGGSFLWVAGSIYLKYKPGKDSVFVKTAIQLLSAAVFCGVLCLKDGSLFTLQLSRVSTASVLSLLYLAIVSTTITFMAFIWLLQQKPPSIVSTYSYINPVVAVLLGALLLHEKIIAIQVISMLIILSGVFLINLPNYKLKKIKA